MPCGLTCTCDGMIVPVRPSCATGSSCHHAARTSRHSSSRAPRSSQGTPTAAYSSGLHPMPRPSTSRPPLTWSRVNAWRASRGGGYHGALMVLVPSRTREVTAAATPRRVSGSWLARMMAGTWSRPPKLTVGLTAASSRSPTHRLSAPCSSAPAANLTTWSICAAPRPNWGRTNPIRTALLLSCRRGVAEASTPRFRASRTAPTSSYRLPVASESGNGSVGARTEGHPRRRRRLTLVGR
jgi:hypothetical protein